MDDKSNEITAIPELLRALDVCGRTVAIDAMGCQKEVAKTIIERGADYALALKSNQRQLYEDVTEMFDGAVRTGSCDLDSDWYETVEKGRGRVETRRCRVVSDPAHIEYPNEDGAWPKLASVAMVESERRVDRKSSRQTRYFISSLPGDVSRLLEAVRGHRGIENSVHWVLDVSFGEDESRVRRGNSAEIFAAKRRMALNMLKQEKSLRVGIAAKRKRAGWDSEYLLKVLNQ